MALYTRLWSAGKYAPGMGTAQLSSLTIQAALEIINTTCTPSNTEIKLAYSLWENQVQGGRSGGARDSRYFKQQASA
jgi:hypothetical protein